MEALEKILAKIPFLLITILYCGWLGLDFYTWFTGPDSELGRKKQSFVVVKQSIDATKKKLKISEEFVNNLANLTARIRGLTAQLDGLKTSLSSELDVSSFVQMLTLEAKKVGVAIKGIKPEMELKREHYIEVPFAISFTGAYVQLLVLFDRITRLQQVIQVGDFELKPNGSAFAKYVELEGKVRLVAFKYLGTKADDILKQPEMKEVKKEGT